MQGCVYSTERVLEDTWQRLDLACIINELINENKIFSV